MPSIRLYIHQIFPSINSVPEYCWKTPETRLPISTGQTTAQFTVFINRRGPTYPLDDSFLPHCAMFSINGSSSSEFQNVHQIIHDLAHRMLQNRMYNYIKKTLIIIIFIINSCCCTGGCYVNCVHINVLYRGCVKGYI